MLKDCMGCCSGLRGTGSLHCLSPHMTRTNYEYSYYISAWKFHSSHIPFSEILHRASSIFFFLERKAVFLCILV